MQDLGFAVSRDVDPSGDPSTNYQGTDPFVSRTNYANANDPCTNHQHANAIAAHCQHHCFNVGSCIRQLPERWYSDEHCRLHQDLLCHWRCVRW